MKILFNKLMCGCAVMVFSLPAFASNQTDLLYSPVPKDLEILDSRLDNLESYVANLEYILDHLSKNVVILQVIPLSKPHASYQEIANYGQNALIESMNYNQENSQYVLSNSARFFTEDGFIKFKDWLTGEKFIDDPSMRSFQSISSVVMGHPIVTNAYVNNHSFYLDRERPIYTWEVDFPMFIELRNQQNTIRYHKRLRAKIVRASIEVAPDQILIDDIQISEYKQVK